MTKILCLETATTVCSAALFEDGKLVAFREIDEGFSHSEKLTVFIEEIVNETNVSIKELSAVAVSNGPGSYTGLRIGMSVAKGICYAADVPMIAVSTLEIMAARAIEELKDEKSTMLFCPMIDARRMEVYCALYDSNLNVLRKPAAVIIDPMFFKDVDERIFFFGDGASKCKPHLNDNFIYAGNIFPSVRFMGSLAKKKFSESIFENVSLAEPVYLKEFGGGEGRI